MRYMAIICLLALFPPHAIGASEVPAGDPEPVEILGACTTPVLQTRLGAICGIVQEVEGVGGAKVRANAYMGIRYANKQTWRNRWIKAQQYGGWKNLLRAVRFGNVCPQYTNPLYVQFPMSEDCLFLNIWTPPDAESGHKLPVQVFIHPGSFTNGSGSDPYYNGAFTAGAENQIVVTFNYRLAALGFLAGIDGLEGNYGFTDQQLALEWVRDNISDWGGDPENVTLSGESAGAMSVGVHLAAAPASRGLFDKALIESNLLGYPFSI